MAADSHPGQAEYSIKAVSQATGLSVETLRAWERRYGVIEPRRGESGHRIYSAHDVSRLIRLRDTTACGHPIGKIAHLSNEELLRLSTDPRCDGGQRGAASMLVERILEAVERYLPEECEQSIALALASLSPAAVVRDVLSPALREVGARWHRGIFTIGQERILSSAVRRQIIHLLHTYAGMARGPVVVFATLPDERHELGILMVAALAASHTLRADYLGTDVPVDVIADHAHRVGAAAVAISLVMPDDPRRAARDLIDLHKRLADPVEIWVGGAAANLIAAMKLPKRIICMDGDHDFEQRAMLLARCAAKP